MLRVSNLFYPRVLARCKLIIHQQLLSTAAPSTTTSVLLQKLPSTVTNESLSKLLAELNCRKVLLEPGCAVHLSCEVEAEEAAKIIVGKLQCQANVINTTIPSLFLQNIPEGISIQHIKDSFQSTGLKLLNIKGGEVYQIKFSNATEALFAANLIKKSSSSFQTNIIKVSENNYQLNIHHWIESSNSTSTTTTSSSSDILRTIQSELQSKFPNISINTIAGKPPSILLRLDSTIDTNKAKEIIQNLTLSSTGSKLKIDNVTKITKPVLLLRNIKSINQDVFTVLSKDNGPLRNMIRIQYISKLKDVAPDFAVAYFNSTSAAYLALEELKQMNIEGEKISVSFKSVAEPAVRIAGLPSHVTEEIVASLFKSIKPVSIQLWSTEATETTTEANKTHTSSASNTSTSKITKTARVVLPGFEDVKIMIEALDCRYINKDGKPITHMTHKERELEEFTANKVEEVTANREEISTTYLQHNTDNDIVTTSTTGTTDEQAGKRVISKRAKRGGQWKETLTVSEDNIYDTGFEISLESPTSTSMSQEDIDQLQSALQEANILTKAIEPNSGRSAFIAYDTIEKASAAQNIFQKGKLSNLPALLRPATLGGSVTSRLSVIPSSTIEVMGLSPELPASTIATLLSQDDTTCGLSIHPYRIDRSALLKFKRHKEVVPGLNKLKTIKIADEDGVLHRLQFSKYRPLTPEGNSEYDTKTELDRFDGDALRSLLKDYMDTDPASRYQIAKNAFERALTDAKAFDDVSSLLNESTIPAARAEAKECLRVVKENPKAHPEAVARLFELFLQRDDFCSFSRDFRAMEAEFGEAEEEDPLNWSQFRFDIPPEVEELVERLQAADKAALDGIGSGIKFKQWKKSKDEIKAEKKLKENLDESRLETMKTQHLLETGVEPTSDEEEEFLSKFSTATDMEERDEDGEEVKVAEFGEVRETDLVDSDGRAWAGTILYSDNVQKTLPGNRVRTKRVLVCIGNLRGAGGFGKGKGKTAVLALNSAFRDALRNLTFIDLYDNYGLYHDLHGKHNSCHAYIQATPKGRPMVGSPFSKAILYNFGISTASVKLIGRRDPYAMCRSIFNALQKHENIDEHAKKRGQRYLTLKWNHDNGV